MFLRKKKNKSGVISVQIIDKSSGNYKVLKTVGSSSDPNEIERLVNEGKTWIKQRLGLQELDFTDYNHHTKLVMQGIEQISVQGPDLLLGKIFDQIGFNKIQQELFKKLVIARLCFPVSKLKTTDYFSKFQFFNIEVQTVYRYLDKLYNEQKENIQNISYQHTLLCCKATLAWFFMT